ncbi:MAG: rhodanese-like domain-containing protein [Gammaproteobacteria bacterium]
MEIINVSGYRFVELDELEAKQQSLLNQCAALNIMGTILLSPEGINMMLAGTSHAIEQLKTYLNDWPEFHNLWLKQSTTTFIPFKRLRVRIKATIIPNVTDHFIPDESSPNISPIQFKSWLDEGKKITVLDTRNQFEIAFGGFDQAIDLHINNFADLPKAINKLDDTLKKTPLVMYCTGGIRCEKASVLLKQQGFQEIYQLEGGIINYFETCGDTHYHGSCYVFDERVALDSHLQPTGEGQCQQCQAPIPAPQRAQSDSTCMQCLL